VLINVAFPGFNTDGKSVVIPRGLIASKQAGQVYEVKVYLKRDEAVGEVYSVCDDETISISVIEEPLIHIIGSSWRVLSYQLSVPNIKTVRGKAIEVRVGQWRQLFALIDLQRALISP
jgi:hypothetical protein